MRLQDKVAIVTGAASGFGAEIARQLARRHGLQALLVLAARNTGRLQSVAAECKALGARTLILPTDVTVEAQCRHLVETTVRECGSLDILVNNAGVSVLSRGDLLDVSAESYDRCLAINTRGTFFLTQAFARRVLKVRADGHRSIVTVSSANAVAPSIARGEYCVSKAGAAMITKLFADPETAPDASGLADARARSCSRLWPPRSAGADRSATATACQL